MIGAVIVIGVAFGLGVIVGQMWEAVASKKYTGDWTKRLVDQGRRLGYLDGVAAGRHEALLLIAGDEEKSADYRTAAAKLAHVCPACTRMCIHCAREKAA